MLEFKYYKLTENLSVCQSSVANDLPCCPPLQQPYYTSLQNSNGQLATTSQQNLIENSNSTKVHNLNQNGRALINQNATVEQNCNFSKVNLLNKILMYK